MLGDLVSQLPLKGTPHRQRVLRGHYFAKICMKDRRKWSLRCNKTVATLVNDIDGFNHAEAEPTLRLFIEEEYLLRRRGDE